MALNVRLALGVVPVKDTGGVYPTRERGHTLLGAPNGALTIGTLDGANIEIRDEVGEENIFIFGLRADDMSSLIQTGYHPEHYLGASHNVRRVVDTIAAGHFSRGDKDIFRPIVAKLLSASDEYVHLADLAPYLETQQRVDEAWLDRGQWNRKSLLNIARMGKFSSDRTIAEYARDIWHIKPAVIGSFAHAAFGLAVARSRGVRLQRLLS